MTSIVNGLFSGRAGISSHGVAIAIVGDNISNASTLGFKTTRAEFEDLIAGGQTSGRVVGSGSSISAVSTIFEQGTLEFTSRPLDLAIDGNGLFVVDDLNGQRFYTRAGNFRVDSEGFITNQNGLRVMGFPVGGSGALEAINVNTVSQDSVATTTVSITGNVNAGADIIDPTSIPATDNAGDAPSSTTTYAELSALADFQTVVKVFDSLGASHDITFYFFHTDTNEYTVQGYVNSEEVDPSGSNVGLPRLIVDSSDNGAITMSFDGDGTRNNAPAAGSFDLSAVVPWINGSTQTNTIDITFGEFTQFSTGSNANSINQDGKGIGTVTSLSIDTNGQIFGQLSNGETSIIATIGLVNFANPEGLTRVGGQLLQQSTESGEPIIGRPLSGTFGAVQSGSVELSTVDIANEFVKLITLQRGFQASSRIITTINQLLNDIIQLA